MANRLGYEAVFAASAVEFFVLLSKRRQRKLLDRAHELVADPFLVPDFRTTDAAIAQTCVNPAAGPNPFSNV